MNDQGITVLLAAALVGLAAYFSWQQARTLRGLSAPEVLGADERRYLRTQAYRRLFCSFLMLVFAGFLIGWLFLEPDNRQLRDEMRAAQEAEPKPPLTEEQKGIVWLISSYWIGALLVLMLLLTLTAADFWATVRYGLNQQRKLRADQKAMLEEHAVRQREERNGQHRP